MFQIVQTLIFSKFEQIWKVYVFIFRCFFAEIECFLEEYHFIVWSSNFCDFQTEMNHGELVK